MAGLATATGLAAAAASAVGAALSVRELTRRLPAETRPMVDWVRADLAARLDNNPALADSQRLTLHQMIAAAALTPQDIAETGQNPDMLLRAMERTLRGHTDQPEYGLDDNLTPFRQIVRPILDRLLNDPAFTAALAPLRDRAFWEMKATGEDTNAVVHQMQATLARIEAGQNLDSIPLEDLRALAQRFEEQDLTSRADLIVFLTLKAGEYQEYKTQIDELDDRVAAVANLKGAAQDAAERLDFDAVEALLSRVDEVETEIAAETKIARARNALMRDRAGQAFDILSAAADGFGSTDRTEPARRRFDYAEILYGHGLRYGGDGLIHAAEMNRDALDRIDRGQNGPLWARAQNNLANALQQQGRRAGGSHATTPSGAMGDDARKPGADRTGAGRS